MNKAVTGILLMTAVLICTLAPGAPVRADDGPVGTVVAVKGDVRAGDGSGSDRKLSMKDPVYVKDTIRTGKTGRVQVLFSDNTIISLGRASSLEISEYLWDKENRTGAMKTTVHEGVFRVMGGALTKHSPSTFKTDTPAGTIGVRGSMYAGLLSEQGLLVAFEGGTGIDVSNGQGSVAITVPGFGTRVASASVPPEPPSRLSAEDMSAIAGELGSPVPDSDEPGDGGAQEDASLQGQETASSDAGTTDGQDGAGEPSESGGQEVASDTSTDDSAALAGGTETILSLEETSVPAQGAADTTDLSTDLGQEVSDVTDTTAQETIVQDVQDAVQDTGVQMSGIFMSALVEGLTDPTVNGTRWYGDAGAVSTNGTLTGSVTAQDGTTFDFSLAVDPYDEDATTYSNPDTLSTLQGRIVTLLGSDRIFEADVFSATTGAFSIFAVKEAEFTDGLTYRYSELGFVGVPSTSTPTDGVYGYFGPSLGFKEAVDEMSASPAKFFMEVNWFNGKAIGIVRPDKTTATTDGDSWEMIFFGDVQGTSLANVTVIGTDSPGEGTQDGDIETMSVNGTTTQFYGSLMEGFGMTGQANLFSVQSDQTARTGVGNITAAGIREYEPGVDEVSPRGVSSYQGFVLGMSEDMSQPGVDRRLFMNGTSDGFSLSVDRDAGTVSGTMSAYDLLSPDSMIDSLAIGGSFGSAYVLDDNFVAILGDSSGSAIVSGASAGGLKPLGNFLVTGDLDAQFSDYLTWGYWEISYTDPSTSADYHLHRPGSLWIAGELTPASVMGDLASTGFTGRYQGGAQGIRIDSAGMVSQLTGGVTDITVDFTAGAVNPISGSINFDQVNLGLTGGYVSASSPSFGAEISGAVSSSVNGAFYGSGAEAVGGNFRAQMTAESYYGIFGGDR